MAIYHLSVKAISRSAGRSATAAAAYRAGVEIADERTGEIHDYTRKGGVESADLVLPQGAPDWARDRAKLWNAADRAEKRKDACVAREFEVALPAELAPAERRRLALDFAQEMANREGCAVDVALHAPSPHGDQRNYHAHMLRTTRRVEADGLGAKLDTEKEGRKRRDDLEAVRARWADLTNQRLREAGIEARVDHRSHAERGLETMPTFHLGPAATDYERRTGQPSDIRTRRLAPACELGELERQGQALDRSILDLSDGLEAAQRECQAAPQRLVDLPMAEQVKAWHVAVAKAQAAREQRIAGVSQKVYDRCFRRCEVADRLRREEPQAASGFLAVFKQQAYQEAAVAWGQSFERARILERQAAALQVRLRQAGASAGAWANDTLSKTYPAFAKRVRDHEQVEYRQKIEQQQREREAKRARQKEQDRGRGR